MRNSFKKALSLVLALTLLMSMVCISNFAVSAETTQYQLGDANTDKRIDVMDSTTIQQIVASAVTATEEQRYLADVTGDGEVDIRDATLIQQYIAMLVIDVPTNKDGYKIGDFVTFGQNPTTPSTGSSEDSQPTSESATETQPTSESVEETSESTEATTESVEETSESTEATTESVPATSEETQPSSDEQTTTYGLHMSDGNGANWKTNPMTVNGDVATVEMQLTAGTYEFKITDGENWYGNNGTIKDTTTTTSKGGWVMETSADNCKLTATGGTYTFAYTISTSKLIVTFVPAETQATTESVEETSESTEATTESVEETSESTEATTESVATKTYTFYFAPLASDVEAGYNFVANILSDVAEDSWFPYEMTATGTTFNGAAVYAAEITVPESQNMLTLQFQVYDDTNWKHQILVVNSTVTPYSAYDGKIVVATANDKGEVKDYVADEETQPTSESETEPQPTSESSEETQPSSDEQTTTYGLHMSDGNGSNWKTNPMTVNGDVATVAMQLTAGTYEFKITDGTNWYGNNGTIADTTTTTSQHGWVMETSADNCKLTATGGTYTFAYTISTSKLIVTFVPAETQATSESETQPTSESSEETQPTSESSEETQASTESVATKTYTFYFAPLASDVEADYKFIANVQSDADVENAWFPYEMTATGTTFNGAAVYAAEITVPESQNMLTLQFQVYDDTNWKHQILLVDNTVTPYSAYDGKIVVATANDKGEVKDYVADEETQATSESETEPQPTSESSEETQPSSDEQTTTYGLHMSDGNGSNWKTNPMTVNGDVATVEMQLTAGTYEFKITDGTNWYGNNGTIADTTTTTSQHGWVMETSADNCKLTATGGTYTFAYTISTSKLIVTFVPAETQATSESETQATTESVEETSESTEETQASTESVATKTYTFYFAPLASDVEADYKFIANVQSDADVENAWFPYEMTATGTTFNGAAVYAAEITVPESQNMLTLQFQVYDDTNWKHQILVVNSTVTPYSAYDGKIVVATANDKGEVKDYVADEETQPTSESETEPQPTSESSEETQPSSDEQTTTYGLHMSDGNGSNWKTNPMTVNGDVATVAMQLTAGTYEFKITDGTNWYGNNGTIADTTTTTSQHGWVMETSADNCKLTATGGTYTFAYTISTSKLIVTFVPAETQATTESVEETSESTEETQATTESVPATSEETQPSSDEQTTTYGLHMSDGNGANWKTNPMTVNGDVATVEMQLTAGTYQFKITDGDKWYGNNGTIEDTTTKTSKGGWVMSTNADNCKLNATGGTYTFAYTISTSKLIVTFVPAETQATTESVEETSESSEETQPTTESSEETQPSSEAGKVIKFTDNQGWGTVYAHMWGDGIKTTWPGTQMEIVGQNDFGENVFAVAVPEGVTGIVFNNGNGQQTVDITLADEEGYYTDGTKDDKGHFNVLPWTSVPATSEETQPTNPSEPTPTEPTPTEPTPTEPTPTEPTPTEPVASAYKVAGNFNDWGNSTDVMYYTSDEVVAVTITLDAGTHKFKITDGKTWYGNNGTIEDTTTITSTRGWDMSPSDGDCTLNATGGSYTFTFNLTTKKLIIVKEA